jgi:ribose 5-phosphate isomerase RpiB
VPVSLPNHGGFESKEYLAGALHEALYEMVDYGDSQGVGAFIAANKAPGVRPPGNVPKPVDYVKS